MMRILNYAAAMQNAWSINIKEEANYDSITTFYQDFTIAEFFKGGLEDTFKRVCKEWLYDYKMFTELIIVLNHKIWEHYNKGKQELSRKYDTMWKEAQSIFFEKYEGNDKVMRYYFRIID